ncbi:MAG: hypothetical protein KAK00_00265 [Nanoarchaeota archaeon]|nr:hypothetical protein [Nanoarchaeota archaeon]
MKTFKIRKIDKEFSRISIEIEFLEDGERRKFGYPMGEGWENKIDGVPKFIKDIKRIISEEEDSEKTEININDLKTFEGDIFKSDISKEKILKKIDSNQSRK